ncbi:adherens junction organization [Desmophyllum pertusum]|uniref:Adherens junction organization n=1 Tax=Desmophyllum pertusum TaxID=174260 RepID=A0A9X0A6I4_9CNID|nr:adherens junction organization [Desmophyllum pertusum]
MGRELDYKANIHRLPMEITEVGSEKSMSSANSYLELFAPHILPRHCVITNMDGIVSVERTSSDAEIYVDGKRIYESTKLNHGNVIKFGRLHTFKFCDPAYEESKVKPSSPAPDAASVSSGHSMSDTDSQKRPSTDSQKRPSRYRPEPAGKNRDYEHQNSTEMTNNHESGMFETTFGVDGEIETFTNEKPTHVQQDLPPQVIHATADDTPDDGMGDKLPARLEYRESGEDAFFAAVISEVNGDRVHFKLAPTYTLYMCCRYRTSRLIGKNYLNFSVVNAWVSLFRKLPTWCALQSRKTVSCQAAWHFGWQIIRTPAFSETRC